MFTYCFCRFIKESNIPFLSRIKSSQILNLFYFGNTTVPITERTNTDILCYVPSLPAGVYDVHLKSPENDNKETDHFKFTILDKPILKGVESAIPQMGQRVTLNGSDFGQEKEAVLIQIGNDPDKFLESPVIISATEIVFRMPFFGTPNQPMPISVWTPSGQSESKTITRTPGVGESPTVQLPKGWQITVSTTASGMQIGRRMSLDEAAAVGRGDLYPFSGGWDDQNIIQETHWYPKADPSLGWIEGNTNKTFEEAGSGHEFQYQYDIYHNTGWLTSPNGMEIPIFIWKPHPRERIAGKTRKLSIMTNGGARAAGQDGETDLIKFTFHVDEGADQTEYLISFQNISAFDVLSNPIPVTAQPGLVKVEIEQTPVQSWMLY